MATFRELNQARLDAERHLKNMATSLREFQVVGPRREWLVGFVHRREDRHSKDADGERISVGSTATALAALAPYHDWQEAGATEPYLSMVQGLLQRRNWSNRNWQDSWFPDMDEPKSRRKLEDFNVFDVAFALDGACQTILAVGEAKPKETVAWLDNNDVWSRLQDVALHVIDNLLHPSIDGPAHLAADGPAHSLAPAHSDQDDEGIDGNGSPASKATGGAPDDAVAEAAVGERIGGAYIQGHEPSAFLTQLATRSLLAYADVVKWGRNRTRISDQSFGRTLDEAHDALRQARQWACKTARTECARLASLDRHADAYEFLHAVMVMASLRPGGTRHAFDHLEDPEERLLAQGAIAAFFERQEEDGSWATSRPLFHYQHRGNAHCYQFEALAQLLQVPALEPECDAHIDRLLAAQRFQIASQLECETPDALLWSSGHAPGKAKPEGWATAASFQFSFQLRRLLGRALRRDVEHFLGIRMYRQGPPGALDDIDQGLLDSALPSHCSDVSFRSVLKQRIIAPLQTEAKRVAQGRPFSKSLPVSILLYGPPGTSKTQTAKVIAKYLEWPLVQVDPSHFLRDGMDSVQNAGSEIFSRLAALDGVVVLLDEVDELMRQRGRGESTFSRFLTTSMLPKLIEINDSRRVVFIVATNHIENFDLAITRAGRFAAVLQVMPPSFASKMDPNDPAFQDGKRAAMRAIAHLWISGEKDWPPDAKESLNAMTYAEYEAFCREVHALGMRDAGSICDLAISWIPRLTMFQLREWSIPAPLCPPASGDDGIDIGDLSVTMRDGDPAGNPPWVTWDWVYRRASIQNKMRLA